MFHYVLCWHACCCWQVLSSSAVCTMNDCCKYVQWPCRSLEATGENRNILQLHVACVWVLRFMLCWTLCCIAYMLGAHGVGSNKVWACKSLKKKATSFCAWCSYGGSKVVPFVCGIPIVYRTAPVGDLRLVFPNALLNCNLPSFTLGLSMLLDQTC